MAADPIEQFKISKLVDFGQVNLPLIGKTDLAFTNSHVAMTIAFLAIVAFLTVVTSNMKVVPGRTQAAGEQLFSMIDDLGNSIIGHEGRALFPFVFTVFSFILAMNLLGLFATFAVTSQLAITATFAILTIGLVLVIGFAKNGLGFFKLFVPSGVPWYAIWMVLPNRRRARVKGRSRNETNSIGTTIQIAYQGTPDGTNSLKNFRPFL